MHGRGGFVAARRGFALVLRKRGSTWSIQRTPNIALARLNSVSCPTTATCTAVGQHDVSGPATVPLIERWTRTGWSIQPTPVFGAAGSITRLTSVSCASAKACVAVGTAGIGLAGSGHTCDYVELALIERWNGSKWSVGATTCYHASAYLLAVSCPSRTACVAVGGSNTSGGSTSIAVQVSPTRWRDLKPAGLELWVSVSCSSAQRCLALDGSASVKVWERQAVVASATDARCPLAAGDCVLRRELLRRGGQHRPACKHSRGAGVMGLGAGLTRYRAIQPTSFRAVPTRTRPSTLRSRRRSSTRRTRESEVRSCAATGC